jgi:hypothetical protein
MGDFIKRNDQEFRAQAALASAVVGGAPTNYGQTALTMTDFDNLVGVYTSTGECNVPSVI